MHLDFETCSMADLRKVGAWKYAQDPTTQVICMAYAYDTGPIRVWVPLRDGPASFPYAALGVHGWNVSFEAAIFEHVLKKPKPTDQLVDTMAAAAVAGYPLGLDRCAEAMKLPFGKDKQGSLLMKRMSRPRRMEKGQPVWWHKEDPAKLDRLIEYCKQDVRVERAIHRKVDPLSTTERAIWRLDFEVNKRGVKLDTELVERMLFVVDEAQTELRERLKQLTNGVVTSPAQALMLLNWINARWGGSIQRVPNLQKQTVATALTLTCTPEVREALEIRQAYAKASTAKLKAMQACAGTDGRMRGLIQYYGANRTGRFAGRLIQPQNLPRPNMDNATVEKAIGFIKFGMTSKSVKAFYGSPLDTVSSCLRGCLVPETGSQLFSVDFSQIEARVLAWLAGQEDILHAFAQGEDVYTLTAQKVGSPLRQLGKVLVLACGYQMGGEKFHDTAKTYGLKLTQTEARDAVHAWRGANPKIVDYWNDCHGKLGAFAREGLDMNQLLCSGRILPYHQLHYTGDGDLAYMGMNPYTRKWEPVKIYGGKLVENIVQATARDIMTEAMLRVHNNLPKWPLVMTVHDELVYEIPEKDFLNGCPDLTLTQLQAEIERPPAWADRLPIATSGWHGSRYRKG